MTLPHGPATARATISAPSPPKHAFDVFVVVPARADVGIRIETPTRATLRVLDSTRRPPCRTRHPYRTCLLHFPRLEAVQGGRWTLVVTKRSVAPARVRVDVSFRR
jgi:hypothetical protein